MNAHPEVASSAESTSRPVPSNTPCEGATHALGQHGHDQGGARYMVRIACPSCSYRIVVAMCAGRVDEVRWSFHAMDCECGITAPWWAFWRDVAPLSSDAIT